MKKKILLLINGLGNSGSEQSLVSFLDFLDYEKYDASVLVLKGPEDLADRINKNVRIIYLYKNSPYFHVSLGKGIKKVFSEKKFSLILPVICANILKSINTKFARHTLESVLKKYIAPEEKYDICVAYEYVTMKYMVNRIRADKKIVRHNYGEIIPKEADRLLFEKCDRVVALTWVLKKELCEKFSLWEDKAVIIPSNFDNRAIEEKALEFNPGFSAKYNFVTVGRITQLKRADLIISAAKIMKDAGFGDFVFHFIGGTVSNSDNDAYFEKVKCQVKENSLEENIVFHGECQNPFPYVKNCDIYVQASDFEAASRSVIEACVLGKPCLSTDTVGGKALIRSGENGELVPVGNEKAFAEKLIFMTENISKYDCVGQYVDNEDIMKKWEELF